ncbi:hypothetical protein [Symbioplanes lichenis]|uniref:hypothetical protein n=1 Tax=Symbioplanes lichenis TaxID=1629072 RepID=UPI00273A354E|nr:hypothetical protein [Actinoplanes lichenis]
MPAVTPAEVTTGPSRRKTGSLSTCTRRYAVARSPASRQWVRVQGGDGGAVLLGQVVVADAQDVVLDARRDQGDLGFEERGDAGRGVQGDREPHAADAVLGHAARLQEAPGLVRAVDLEAAVRDPASRPDRRRAMSVPTRIPQIRTPGQRA